MFLRVFFFLLGFGFMVIGFTYIITYLNLLTIGFTFNEYIDFITHRYECLIAIVGFVIINLTILI